MPATTAQREEWIAIDDYLAGERDGEVRHEYIDGRVYAMTGASRVHGLIANALAVALTPAARKRRCQLFTSDMKLRLEIGGKTVFYYPDLLLTCNPQDDDAYFCTAPCLLIEVLSASTARIDRREKLLAYQTLPSLQAYWMVAQDAQHIEICRRADDWRLHVHEAGAMPVDCLDMALTVEEVYQDVAL